MLPADDAAVVARDPDLPGFAAVLDADLLAERLTAALPGVSVTAGTAMYVRYKPRTSCLVQHRLVIGGREQTLTAKAFAAHDAEKARKAVSAAAPDETPGAGAVFVEPDATAVLFFPNDPQLPALRALAAAQTRPGVLRRVVAGWPVDSTSFTLVSHRPERRFVALVDSASGQRLVLKGYGADGFGRARSASKAFASASDATVAARIGSSSRHRLLAFTWIDGEPLDRAIGEGRASAAQLEELGSVLADFQARRSRHLERIERSAEARSVLNAAQAVAVTVPHLAGRVRDVATRVAQGLLELPPLDSAVHGDFSADQVVLGQRPAIIDYDAAGLGDPASDVARFAAATTAEVIAGRLSETAAARAADAVCTGHAQAVGSAVAPSRFALYRAAWLLRLAPEPFRRRRPEWVAETEQLVEAAAR